MQLLLIHPITLAGKITLLHWGDLELILVNETKDLTKRNGSVLLHQLLRKVGQSLFLMIEETWE